MKFTREHYTISRATLEEVLGALASNRTSGGSGDEDSRNNDDVIDAHDLLEAEVEAQESAQ